MADMDKMLNAIKNIKIVSDEEAEKVDFVVCGYPPGHFSDDITTVCSKCGKAIVHRPHAPKRPPKICFACLPDAEVPHGRITESVANDVVAVNKTFEGVAMLKKKWGLD